MLKTIHPNITRFKAESGLLWQQCGCWWCWLWCYDNDNKLLSDDSDSSDHHGFMNFYGILLVSKFSSFLCWSNMQTSILIFSLQINPSSIMESIGNWSSKEHQDGNLSTLQPQFFSPLEACLRYVLELLCISNGMEAFWYVTQMLLFHLLTPSLDRRFLNFL